MVDQVTKAGSDRPVARVGAAAAPTPIQPPPMPTRQPAPADVARLSGVAAELAAKPPVDSERVAQIKKAVADGTFPILPATIADRLLALRYDWLSHDPRSL